MPEPHWHSNISHLAPVQTRQRTDVLCPCRSPKCAHGPVVVRSGLLTYQVCSVRHAMLQMSHSESGPCLSGQDRGGWAWMMVCPWWRLANVPTNRSTAGRSWRAGPYVPIDIRLSVLWCCCHCHAPARCAGSLACALLEWCAPNNMLWSPIVVVSDTEKRATAIQAYETAYRGRVYPLLTPLSGWYQHHVPQLLYTQSTDTYWVHRRPNNLHGPLSL